MAKLIPSLLDFLMRLQEPIHGPDGAKILTFVQKGRIDFLRGFIHELLRVEDIEHLLPLLSHQGTRGRRTFLRFG
jgi:hypothetical protein